MEERNYLYGVLNGKYKRYNENGQLIEEITYYNGNLHGQFLKYYEGG